MFDTEKFFLIKFHKTGSSISTSFINEKKISSSNTEMEYRNEM